MLQYSSGRTAIERPALSDHILRVYSRRGEVNSTLINMGPGETMAAWIAYNAGNLMHGIVAIRIDEFQCNSGEAAIRRRGTSTIGLCAASSKTSACRVSRSRASS
jgi:hypothetical protein